MIVLFSSRGDGRCLPCLCDRVSTPHPHPDEGVGSGAAPVTGNADKTNYQNRLSTYLKKEPMRRTPLWSRTWTGRHKS